MTYSTSNPPVLVSQGIGNQGIAIWHYSHATDASAAVDAAGYISNGGQLGLKVGDLVFSREIDTDIVSSHVVKTVNATTGAVDLTEGTVIGSGTAGD